MKVFTADGARRGRVGQSLLTAGVCLAAGLVPTATQAQVSKSLDFTRKVSVDQGVLTTGTTVMVHGTVSHPAARVSGWWGAATVTGVVRHGIEHGYQRPYTSHGYRCTPDVKGKVTRYVCTRREAGLATFVQIRFDVRYKQHPVGSAAPGADHSLAVDVTGLPAGKLATLTFDDAVLSPYSGAAPGVPTYSATGASSLVLPRNAVVIGASKTATINATLKILVALTDASATDLTGQADIPDGTKLTVNVDNRGAQAINAGAFSVSVK